MTNLNLNVQPSLLLRLDEYAKKLGFTKSKIAENAISQYLDEFDEDEEDIADATRIIEKVAAGKQRLIPAVEVYRRAGL